MASKENEKRSQELYMQLQIIQENAKELHRQIQLVENQYIELTATSQSLAELKKIKTNSKIFVPLSSGIFLRAELTENNKLIVNIGANVAVEKDIESTKGLIVKQLEELKELRDKMAEDLKKIATQGALIEGELQKSIKENV